MFFSKFSTVFSEIKTGWKQYFWGQIGSYYRHSRDRDCERKDWDLQDWEEGEEIKWWPWRDIAVNG